MLKMEDLKRFRWSFTASEDLRKRTKGLNRCFGKGFLDSDGNAIARNPVVDTTLVVRLISIGFGVFFTSKTTKFQELTRLFEDGSSYAFLSYT